MKKLLWRVLSFSLLMTPVFALQNPDSFQVETRPATAKVNESIDIIIKAIKNQKVMKEYEGEVYVDIEEILDGGGLSMLGINDRDFPYAVKSLSKSDQGEKVFSKGLFFKRAGNFKISVNDFANDKAIGSTTIVVVGEADIFSRDIEISSPVSGGEQMESQVMVMATAAELPNVRMQVFLNGVFVAEDTTNVNGGFAKMIQVKDPWENKLQLKAIAAGEKIIGLSEEIVFKYKPLWGDLLNGLKMNPTNGLKLGDRVRFEADVHEMVSSAKLILSPGGEYPLDKEKDGIFSKTLMLTMTGEVTAALELRARGSDSKYDEVLKFSVKDHVKIGEVKISLHPSLAGNIDLAWLTIGEKVENFAIKYGLNKDKLEGILLTKEQKATIPGFTYGTTYYFQVTALSSENEPEGLPSEVIEFTLPILAGAAPTNSALTDTNIQHPAPEVIAAPTCVVKNVQFRTEKIGNKYYMIWNPVKNTEKYRIFKSDPIDANAKSFLGETTVPRFEYPFDRKGEESYEYYTVEAICTDGQQVIIANAQKVQVGPLEDIIMILAATALFYLLYRIYTAKA